MRRTTQCSTGLVRADKFHQQHSSIPHPVITRGNEQLLHVHVALESCQGPSQGGLADETTHLQVQLHVHAGRLHAS